MKSGSKHTAEARAKVAEKTHAAMSDPAVRQRIRDRMLEVSGATRELRALRAVWRATKPSVRIRFLTELLAPLCSAAAMQTTAVTEEVSRGTQSERHESKPSDYGGGN